MKLSIILLTASVYFLCISSAFAAVERDKGWSELTGNDLLASCQLGVGVLNGRDIPKGKEVDAVQCAYYIEGFLDGLSVRDINSPHEMFCFPAGVTTAQMIRVITKWLEDHPARLHEPAFGLTFLAVQDSFLCPAPKPAK